MKKLLAVALCLCLVLSMAGCSLFTSGGDGKGKSTGDLKITEKLVHKDPTDVAFTDRYTFYSGETAALADMFKEQFDLELKQEFLIVYANGEDAAVQEYIYYVFGSAEDAQKYLLECEGYDMDASITEEDPVVMRVSNNQEALKNSIDSFIAWSVLEDTSAAKYVKMYAEMDGLVEYNPE